MSRSERFRVWTRQESATTLRVAHSSSVLTSIGAALTSGRVLDFSILKSGEVMLMRISRRNSTLTVQAPAKLNLSLKVLGRRPDGFHDLETVMISLRFYDTLTFSPASGTTVELTANLLIPSHTHFPTDSQNLIVRAANLLCEQTGVTRGVQIHVTKRIPSEAGLGGGSSDAAATLVALNQLWQLQLTTAKLHQLAAKLGSDLNFFIESPTAAICRGRGERIDPVLISRPLHFVIFKPGGGLSTGAVFRAWGAGTEQSGNPTDRLKDSLSKGNLRQISESVLNSLQEPARTLSAEIDTALNLIQRQHVLVAGMTGSGSACFGLCHSLKHAQSVAARLKVSGQSQAWAATTGI